MPGKKSGDNGGGYKNPIFYRTVLKPRLFRSVGPTAVD